MQHSISPSTSRWVAGLKRRVPGSGLEAEIQRARQTKMPAGTRNPGRHRHGHEGVERSKDTLCIPRMGHIAVESELFFEARHSAQSDGHAMPAFDAVKGARPAAARVGCGCVRAFAQRHPGVRGASVPNRRTCACVWRSRPAVRTVGAVAAVGTDARPSCQRTDWCGYPRFAAELRFRDLPAVGEPGSASATSSM